MSCMSARQLASRSTLGTVNRRAATLSRHVRDNPVALSFTACKKLGWVGGHESGHDFSRALPTRAGLRFVSGHDFSRAAAILFLLCKAGFSPQHEAGITRKFAPEPSRAEARSQSKSMKRVSARLKSCPDTKPPHTPGTCEVVLAA